MSDIEILQYIPRLGNLSVSEKINEAEMLKAQGNIYVKSGDYNRALSKYAMVFAYVNGLFTKSDSMAMYNSKNDAALLSSQDESLKIQYLKQTVWSNMALCYLKTDKYAKAMEVCDKILGLDPAHFKALFRKSQALAYLHHYDRAKAILRQLVERDPSNSTVRKELVAVSQSEKKLQKEENSKSSFANIFNKNVCTT
uniref:Uncharacterized protein AlNc14C245G9542 n=1 Tax=Albugo laibachii Nc14 TaxID=890382 RepID=F0WT58_9STRA|nr:conserved hypothetical protein [Albugo laibachii Nc14]CCA25966.1 conserved hypothetical protein [Albugo laibachii Nc14]|eukprot:CCA25966.1 conserved hypothetical protein [Albugo laibachii Nc14]